MSEQMQCHTDVLYYIMQLLQWPFRGHRECFVLTLSFALLTLKWDLILIKGLILKNGS